MFSGLLQLPEEPRELSCRLRIPQQGYINESLKKLEISHVLPVRAQVPLVVRLPPFEKD